VTFTIEASGTVVLPARPAGDSESDSGSRPPSRSKKGSRPSTRESCRKDSARRRATESPGPDAVPAPDYVLVVTFPHTEDDEALVVQAPIAATGTGGNTPFTSTAAVETEISRDLLLAMFETPVRLTLLPASDIELSVGGRASGTGRISARKPKTKTKDDRKSKRASRRRPDVVSNGHWCRSLSLWPLFERSTRVVSASYSEGGALCIVSGKLRYRLCCLSSFS
jgi:hypothetical protein